MASWRKTAVATTVGIVALAATNGAAAHHSFAMFDMDKTMAVTGTVKEFVWANPHSWLYLSVLKSDGKVEEWGFEGASPNMMDRWGWKASDIKVGDKVTVDTHPARDGKFIGSIYAIYLPTGKSLFDPMGQRVRAKEFANAPPAAPTKPTGTPYR